MRALFASDWITKNGASPSEMQSFFESLSDTTIDSAHFTYSGGVSAGSSGWSPGGAYGAQYVRDFAMTVRGRPEKFSGPDILAALAVFAENQRVDGRFPDGVHSDGVTLAGGGGRYYGVDDVYEFVDLAYSHYQKTFTTTAFTDYYAVIEAALASHTIDNHLVVLNEGTGQIGFGFQDSVWSQGYELMCSAYRYRAFSQLSEMANAAGETDIWSAELPLIRAAIEATFSDSGDLLCNAADFSGTLSNPQHSIPANAYAVVVGAVSSVRADAIANYFLECRAGGSMHATKNFYQDGQIRHLPADEDWDAMTDAIPLGEYQNGGYWATFTGWVAQALRRVSTAEAESLLGELYAKFLADSPSERPIEASNSDIGYKGQPNYVVSATLPLQAIKGAITR